MSSQSLIYSSSIANTAGDGPWVDISTFPNMWTIHIENWVSTVSVEVSNEIPVPTTPNPNNPSQTRAAYPPYPHPETVSNHDNENHAIASTVTVAHPPAAGSAFADRGVVFAAGPQAGVNLQFMPGITNAPGAPGQYSVNPTTGEYLFNATDVTNGFAVNISYTITTPNAGVVLPNAYYIPNPPAPGHVLVIAKSDLNVKWVRVRDSAGAGSPPQSLVLAFLHTGK